MKLGLLKPAGLSITDPIYSSPRGSFPGRVSNEVLAGLPRGRSTATSRGVRRHGDAANIVRAGDARDARVGFPVARGAGGAGVRERRVAPRTRALSAPRPARPARPSLPLTPPRPRRLPRPLRHFDGRRDPGE